MRPISGVPRNAEAGTEKSVTWGRIRRGLTYRQFNKRFLGEKLRLLTENRRGNRNGDLRLRDSQLTGDLLTKTGDLDGNQQWDLPSRLYFFAAADFAICSKLTLKV